MSLASGFICDRSGSVRSVVSDRLTLGLAQGSPWTTCVHDESGSRAASMLKEATERRVSADWELTLLRDGAVVPVYAAAAALESGYLVVVARSRGELAAACDGLRRLPEAAEADVDALCDRVARSARERDDIDARALTDLSSMNNELVTSQREQIRLRRALERANEEKNRLLGTVAHDLRTPIGVVLGYARLLAEDDTALGPDQRTMVEAIVRNAEHMSNIASDALDLAAIQSGNLSLELARIDVQVLLNAVARDAAMIGAHKDVSVVAVPADGNTAVEADSRRLTQAVFNLVDNAIKFSPPGSTVCLRVEPEESALVVRITDEGPGLSETEPGTSPFQRGRSGTAGEKSTGLGLAIVRRIVEAHGGTLELESTPGAGTTAVVELPRCPQPAPTTTST